MTPTPAIAPYVPNYAVYTPYITPTEFLNAPTGVDVSQLVPSGSTLTQQAALLDLIARASSEADRICQKVLAATADVISGEYRIMPGGQIWVPVKYTPLIAVTGVQIGYVPGQLTALTDLSGVWVAEKTARIPIGGLGYQLPNTIPAAATPRHGRVYAIVNYVNGWAHTTIAQANAATQVLTPASVLGIVPGLTLTIKDGANTETVTVASSYIAGTATVPLTAPLQYTHTAGTTLSALPPVIKDAVLDLCKWLVRSRGSKGIVMGSIKGNALTTSKAKTQPDEKAGDADYQNAVRALAPFKRSR